MALIKLKCHYCKTEVYRVRQIIAPVCQDCQNKKENARLYQVRRNAMLNDNSGHTKKRILKEHKKYRDDHDYADRSNTLRPRKFWDEGEKLGILERVASDDDLARRHKVSVSAIRAVRTRMKQRQVQLIRDETNRRLEAEGRDDE